MLLVLASGYVLNSRPDICISYEHQNCGPLFKKDNPLRNMIIELSIFNDL